MGAREKGRGGAAGELPYSRWAVQTLEERVTAGDRRSRGAVWAVSVGQDGETWGAGATALDPLRRPGGKAVTRPG